MSRRARPLQGGIATMLIVWGKNERIFPAAGAEPNKRDLKAPELHLLDAGHFALETHCEQLARRMRELGEARHNR